MKSRPVVALDVVREDVQAAYDYFTLRGASAGAHFLENYFAITDRMAANPEFFPFKFDDYRRALVPQSYLAVYYFIEPERSVVVAVADARRHPPPHPRPCARTQMIQFPDRFKP